MKENEIYSFQVISNISEDLVKLKKLPIIQRYYDLQINQNITNSKVVFIPTERYTNVVQTYDISIICGNTSNIIGRGEIECYNEFFVALSRLYNTQKLLLLVESNKVNFQIFVILTEKAFIQDINPDDLTNLQRNIFFRNNLKILFQYLYSLKDDCIQYDSGSNIIKKKILDLYSYVKENRVLNFKIPNSNVIATSCENGDASTLVDIICDEDDHEQQVDSVFTSVSDTDCSLELSSSSSQSDLTREKKQRKTSAKEFERGTLQHKNLVPLLRPYQVEAVEWMLFKEKNDQFEIGEIKIILHVSLLGPRNFFIQDSFFLLKRFSTEC